MVVWELSSNVDWVIMNPNLQLTIVAELMSICGVLVMSIIILVIGCLDKKA